MKTHAYQKQGNDFDSLSLRDLLDVRELYHIHLMNHPNVMATAVGRYRIRVSDPWPDSHGARPVQSKAARTLSNSEIRPYSWPCILVFVDKWVDESAFGKGDYAPNEMVPKTLYLPDGRKAPVCVVLSELETEAPATPKIIFPVNNIGGGNPVIAKVQGTEHIATISCLVSDGHRTYALTNRHVVGDPGETIYSELRGVASPIGTTSAKQLTRMAFSEVYSGWPGANVFVNLDAGLIDISNLDAWTAKIRGLGVMGRLADLSVNNLSLSLVGCRVVGIGAARGRMTGEITALFYRYKSVGGFEYIADFIIGPRADGRGAPAPLTEPGNSGALWLLDPVNPEVQKGKDGKTGNGEDYRPFAIQWGEQVFTTGGSKSYALATCLSTVLSQLNLDLVRDWNLDQVDTWGSIGHFSIAFSVARALTNDSLHTLMTKNAEIISPNKEEIISSTFKGLGSEDFVPLADVPDMYWKPRISKQGFTRAMEGPNHFADMDQHRDSDGHDLLDLTENDNFIDAQKWNEFYNSVQDILTRTPIQQQHRGLLPFRVWQIFNDMVRFVKRGDADRFVCAAGVLTHYVGDACQPLHISYLHDGDPAHPVTRTVHHKDGTTEKKTDPLGAGVHSAYEDAMVNAHKEDILDALAKTPEVKASELLQTGFEAAKGTITMMRTVFKRIPPAKIVQFYVDSKAKPAQLSEDMWKEFGDGTMECMQDGAHLLAVLWQSAWVKGGGDHTIKKSSMKGLTKKAAMKICQNPDFLPSVPVAKITTILNQPV